MILFFQPYYSRLGHFKPYTDKISIFFNDISKKNKTILGVHSKVDFGHVNYSAIPTYGNGRFSLIALTFKCYMALYKAVKSGEFKTVHVLDYEISLLYLTILFLGKNASNCKWCITVHSINFLTKRQIILLPYQLLAKHAYKKLDSLNFSFFCNGSNSYSFLKNKFDVQEKNLLITHWGLDKKPQQLSTKFFNSILFLGVLRKDKNLEFSLSQLSKINIPFKLIIAGYPQDYTVEEINELVKRYHLENKVSLDLTYLSQTQMDYYLENTEFILIPYDHTNVSNSGPLMDGIANNCIPIVSAYGERKTIVESIGLNTFVFDDEQNSLSKLLTSFLTLSQKEREEIRKSIHEKSVEFTWESIFKVYQSRY